MIVSFPMYDRAETRPAWNRLWTSMRMHLLHDRPDLSNDLPDSPSYPANPWDHWNNPDLLLSQTCGLPYRTRLHQQLTLVGAPDFGHPDCPPGHYHSVIIQRRNTAASTPEAWPNLTFAVNMFDSQSGWAAPQNWLLEQGLEIEKAIVTGSHRASAQAVAEGRADIAALDAQTWRMIKRWDGFAPLLKVVARTPPTPALPLVTARADLADDLAKATQSAIAQLSDIDRRTTDLTGVIRIPPAAYLAVPTPPPL